MARKRTGSLILQRSGWSARVTTIVGGKRKRVMRALGTMDEKEATAKLAAMLNGTSELLLSAAGHAVHLRFSYEEWTRILEESTRRHVTPAALIQSVVRERHWLRSHTDERRVTAMLSEQDKEDLIVICLGGEPGKGAEAAKRALASQARKRRASLTQGELTAVLSHARCGFERDEVAYLRLGMLALSVNCLGLAFETLRALRWRDVDMEADTPVAIRPWHEEPLRAVVLQSWTRGFLDAWKSMHLIVANDRLGRLLRDLDETALQDALVFPEIELADPERWCADLLADIQDAFRYAVHCEASECVAPGEYSDRWIELFEETERGLPVDLESAGGGAELLLIELVDGNARKAASA